MPRPRIDAAGLGGSERMGFKGSRVRIPPSRPSKLLQLDKLDKDLGLALEWAGVVLVLSPGKLPWTRGASVRESKVREFRGLGEATRGRTVNIVRRKSLCFQGVAAGP